MHLLETTLNACSESFLTTAGVVSRPNLKFSEPTVCLKNLIPTKPHVRCEP